MAQEDKLRVFGNPNPKGTAWLEEVRLDATRNTIEQLRHQKESQEYELAKARGITTQEILSKGKKDLGIVDEDYEDFDADEETKSEKTLKQMNKAELREVANAEGVVVDDEATNAQLVSAIEEKRGEE